MSRESRKKEHITLALSQGALKNTSFDDLVLLHNPIPELSLDEISLASNIGGLTTSSPLFINAMTGGAQDTLIINQQLAIVAKELKVPLAVGSQMAAIKTPDLSDTFSIVRKENPDGIIIANLGQEATLDQAQRAIEMVAADAMQIHLNVMQELIMPEGDRDFTGTLKRISTLVEKLEVPLIVKEVGFGMPMEAIRRLKDVGVRIVDVGGKGGTNFAKIENQRGNNRYPFLNSWGITTPVSLLEASLVSDVQLIGSGGVQNGLDVVKVLALGASLAGMAGTFLFQLHKHGVDGLINFIKDLLHQIRLIMTAIGAKDIASIQKCSILIKGEAKEWCIARGIPIDDFARRRM